jgi:hypothetical protein
MTALWKFFAGIALGLLTFLTLQWAAFCLVLGVPTQSSLWTFEVVRKKQELARASAPPRLLLVGGSGTLFGLSAREIERETGRRAINLGTHAGLGGPYVLAQARQLAKPGDTVLLVFEYELYTRGPIQMKGADSMFLDYLVARDPAYIRQFPLWEQWNTFMLTPNPRVKLALENRFSGVPCAQHETNGGVYNADFINAWGDQTHQVPAAAHLGADISGRLSGEHLRDFPAEPAGFPALALFCRWAQTNGIRVLATYPNLLDDPLLRAPAAKSAVDRIAGFFAQLGVPVIGDYTDDLLPRDQFFDTCYHLTEEGALARTKRLVEKLRPYLK